MTCAFDQVTTQHLVTTAIDALEMGGVWYLTNGLPYASALEDGHSRLKAPLGVVGINVLLFPDMVAQAALEAGKS